MNASYEANAAWEAFGLLGGMLLLGLLGLLYLCIQEYLEARKDRKYEEQRKNK